MAGLTAEQVERFNETGCLVAESAVTPEELAALRRELAGWTAEAERRGANFGESVDGRARFDVGAALAGGKRSLRRVNNPVEVSDAYYAVMARSRMTDMIADLIGPDVKFHHSKINLKLPGADTVVRYHQDFSYTPHSNPDVVTALLMLDDMTADNGCLTVVPGSHREGQVTLWRDGRFTGMIGPEDEAAALARAEPVTGPAGSACLMHTLLMHGSDANRSAWPRGLFICVYSAADAVPLAPSPVPSRFEGVVVRGQASRFARCEALSIELPERYEESSFFDVQGRRSAAEA